MDKNNLNEYVKEMDEALDNKIRVITSIKYYYDLEKITSFISELSNEDLEKVLEELINKKLKQIKKNNKIDDFRRNNKYVADVTEFFYNSQDDDIIEEGSSIATDLVLKLMGINGRKIELPIKVSYIKDYCISNVVEEKKVRKTLLWIASELCVINYFLNNRTKEC